jgi:hypothetical protein
LLIADDSLPNHQSAIINQQSFRFMAQLPFPMSRAERCACMRPVHVAITGTFLACILGVATDSSGQTATKRIEISLRAITVAAAGETATVVIEASGPLSPPSSGFASNPARIYIDFTDVTPGQPVQPVQPNPIVRRVRVAEHNAAPLVTRVVIDLTKAMSYRIDSSKLTHGRLVVMLGVADTVDAPKPQSPPPTQPAPSAKPQPPTPPPSSAARDAARATPQPPQPAAAPAQGSAAQKPYEVRVSAALVRLHALRPLLESIDRQVDPLPGNLDAAVGEFESVAKLLGGIKAPRARESAHALLQRTCTMGARAVRMRQDGARTNDSAATLNAASAAAGALMMMDRANRELAGEGK